MSTVIFVHGISVRKAGYETAFSRIEKNLAAAMARAGLGRIELADCLWGDSLGARLNMEGLSIPDYEVSGGQATAFAADDDHILLWEMLGYDPLYELHGLALRRRQPVPTFNHVKFTAAVRALPDADLSERLSAAGLACDAFTAARDNVLSHRVYQDVLLTSSGRGDCRLPLARAILAVALALADDQPPPLAATDPVVRDSLVSALADAIAPSDMGALGWAQNKLYGLATELSSATIRGGLDLFARALTPVGKWRRGNLTDAAVPLAGDLLLYQAKGQGIRDFIREKIERSSPPVVLLAHSLGGIACVDLLVRQALPEVARSW